MCDATVSQSLIFQRSSRFAFVTRCTFAAAIGPCQFVRANSSVVALQNGSRNAYFHSGNRSIGH